MKAYATSPDIRGLGTDGTDGWAIDTSWITPGDPTGLFSTTNTTNTTSVNNPSGLDSVLKITGALTNSFTNIFKAIQPLPAGCQTVAGPYGTSVQCAGGSQPLSNFSVGSGIGGISPIILIGGAALLFMMMKK